MQKIRLGICIEDQEYENRFTGCLMNHYKTSLELHIYTGLDQLMAIEQNKYDILLMADCAQSMAQITEIQQKIGKPVVYLQDRTEECFEDQTKSMEEIWIVEKYQEVNKIVDEIMKHIGDEIKQVQQYGTIKLKTRVVGVYSLSENEYQVPFMVTLASIMGEGQRVLILDMQENSGFMHLLNQDGTGGVEELAVMAETGKFSYSRLAACIGHMENIDFVYPMSNTESICEMNSTTCIKIIQMICHEMDYDVIILNLGARFMGFYEVLNYCHNIYLMQRKGGLCQWREYEFEDEVVKRGYKSLLEKITKIEVPFITTPSTSCERLIEQWRWNEFGDLIRNTVPEVARVG